MMALRPAEVQRLAAILGRLGSEFAGERDAAALAASKFVHDRALGWEELLQAEPPTAVAVIDPGVTRYWKHAAEECLLEHSGALNDWETEFLQDLLRRGRAPTARQEAVLRRIATKTGVPQW